jgi:DNA polymerase III epsilon subunit-like protein
MPINSEVDNLKNLCVIGIETTGLDVVNDKILEIGIVRIDKARNISGKFSSVVWPGEEVFSLSETARALAFQNRHKIDFINAPSPEEVAKAVLAFIGDWKDTLITSFNVPFERGFLQRKVWERIGKGYPWPVCIMDQCSNIIGPAGSPCRSWNEYRKAYNWPRMTEAAHYFGVSYDPRSRHSALHDAEVSAGIYLKIIERGGIEDEP